MRSVPVVLLMLFVFSVPWEYSLDLGEPFGNVARILGLMLLAVVPVCVLRRGRLRHLGALQWLVLAFYFYFTCSFFWTVNQETTFEKIRAYFQVMMIVWIVWEVATAPQHLRGLLRAFVAGCWVLAVLTMLPYFVSGVGEAAQIRFVAAGQDPNDVARFLDLGIPFGALLFATEERWPMRALAGGYIPAALAAVVLTASRGGFSASMVALLGSAVLLLSWRPKAATGIFLGLLLLAGVLWLFVPAGTLDRLGTIPEQVGSGDLNDRLSIWIDGWRAFTRSPWWGYGAGTYADASGLAPGDTAHNTVMAVMVTGGLAGTAIFGAILAGSAWAVAQTRGVARIALGTALTVWFVSSMVGSVEENRTTWLLIGMIAVAGRLANEERQELTALFSGPSDEPGRVRLHAAR